MPYRRDGVETDAVYPWAAFAWRNWTALSEEARRELMTLLLTIWPRKRGGSRPSEYQNYAAAALGAQIDGAPALARRKDIAAAYAITEDAAKARVRKGRRYFKQREGRVRIEVVPPMEACEILGCEPSEILREPIDRGPELEARQGFVLPSGGDDGRGMKALASSLLSGRAETMDALRHHLAPVKAGDELPEPARQAQDLGGTMLDSPGPLETPTPPPPERPTPQPPEIPRPPAPETPETPAPSSAPLGI